MGCRLFRQINDCTKITCFSCEFFFPELPSYRGLTGEFLLLQNFSVAISVSPKVCFILVLILISMFLR